MLSAFFARVGEAAVSADIAEPTLTSTMRLYAITYKRLPVETPR